jgi:hypothetical protein
LRRTFQKCVHHFCEPADGIKKTCQENNASAATNKKCKGGPDDLKCMCENLDAIELQSNECRNDCIMKGAEIDLFKETVSRIELCKCVQKAAP